MKSSFWRTEDFVVTVLGVSIVLLSTVALLYSNLGAVQAAQKRYKGSLDEASLPASDYRSVAWYEAYDLVSGVRTDKSTIGAFLKGLSGKPGSWTTNPVAAVYLSTAEASARAEQARISHETHQRKAQDLRTEALRLEVVASQEDSPEAWSTAAVAVSDWRSHLKSGEGLARASQTKPYNRLGHLLLLCIVLGILFGVGQRWLGERWADFVKGFAAIFALTVVAQLLGSQTGIRDLGIGHAAWAILLGLVISNTIGTPGWARGALCTELYIKTGLVILGAEILLSKILAIGLPGIFVAWIVTPMVLLTTYWFGQRVLKITSKTLNITISADMSVCGVSAAIATAAACRASKEELTVAVGLSMIFTSVMMIVMPIAIKAMGLPEVLGGAWIGGTIDATGAVVAAGAFLGDTALKVAATIKMIQNILIGAIAFGVAIYFTRTEQGGAGQKVGAREIWIRFPKFVLGFIGVSIAYSILYKSMGDELAFTLLDQGVISGFTSPLKEWMFGLAFVSIGLSTNFKQFRAFFSGGKPLLLYVCGQSLNLAMTLLMAYIMFYLVFPDITAGI